MGIFEEWLARKLDRGGCTLRERRIVEEEYFRIHGPRSSFERAVLDGILDELLTDDSGYLVTKARFTLQVIGYHQVESCPAAFYLAARAAVSKIVDGNKVYPWEQGRGRG
jgi:hypothetical protein